jgi:hypothetical protein
MSGYDRYRMEMFDEDLIPWGQLGNGRDGILLGRDGTWRCGS